MEIMKGALKRRKRWERKHLQLNLSFFQWMPVTEIKRVSWSEGGTLMMTSCRRRRRRG